MPQRRPCFALIRVLSAVAQAPEEQLLTTPQERVALVRPFWEKLPQDDRVRHLTLSLDEVRARAELIVERHKKQAGASVAAYSVAVYVASVSRARSII